MGENTTIEWATHTFNPWIGCEKVSPACDHCYAEHLMDTRLHRVEWGGDRKRTSAANWSQPLRWNAAAERAGVVASVFCLSLGDIWDKEVEPIWRRDLFGIIERTPWLLWLLLSKRIGNAEKMCDPMRANPLLPSNAALGSTVINQDEWDRDLPKLKQAAEHLGARFTFASVEPMLGPIDAHGELPDWVIVGGESGQHARPMHPDWARRLRDQCAASGVPFLFKQWGEWAPHQGDLPTFGKGSPEIGCAWPDGTTEGGTMHQHGGPGQPLYRIGKKAAGRLLDGAAHDGFPA